PHINRSLRLVSHDLLQVFECLAGGTARWPLFLWGGAGGGKTCAALALCDIAATAAFWELDRLASFVVQRSDEVDSELRRLAEKELIVIDEIGTRLKSGDLHYATLKMACDVREQHANRAMIAISNVAPHDIEGIYDDRIASRLLAGTVFELRDDDRREAR
ncbi:MAG: hypothetical protein K8U03_06905, partial [Planctomycetia bacterium]|nr:hypothetical protein [Planctomycetia bacterium]